MTVAHKKRHGVRPEKKAAVQRIAKLIEEYPIIGIVDMSQLPGKNLAAMRKRLRGKVAISMTKKRLLALAIKESKKPGIAQLEQHLVGMPAMLFTKENPFSLFKTLKKNQSPAPIKPGQIAPSDIVIPAGPTSFAPGPMIGELGALGIKAGVEGGKIAIKVDATVAHEGQVVNEKVASFLQKMGIEPMRIGLKLTAVYENGEVVKGKVLDIDEDKFKADLNMAILGARGLAIEIAYTTEETIKLLLSKAHYQAAGLALESNLLTDETARQVLAKAYWQALGVAKYLPEDMRPEIPVADAAEENKEEKKDEKKSEEEAAAGLGSLFG